MHYWTPGWRGRDEEATVRFGKSEDIGTINQVAERVLTAFRESEVARPAGTILGIEEELRGELVRGVPDLLARIDLLMETDHRCG